MIDTNFSNANLLPKKHFEILDGLRGIAAICVVIFHFLEMVIPRYEDNFLAHGFLAVDFFFCLSGFVIAYAYDGRMGSISLKSFFKGRLIRLHPLVILGSVLGLLTFIYNPVSDLASSYSTSKTLLIFITSLLLIPFGAMPERSFNLFSFNAPAWSLFWEYIANIFYAFGLYRLARKYLAALTVLAAVVLVYVSHQAKGLSGGWSIDNFWDGGARIFFSFLAGMLIHRFNFILKSKLGFISLSLLLIFALVIPFSEKWNWYVEALVILLFFPLLISLGAGATLSKSLTKICQFSGKISYPLYMTHYAVIWIFLDYCKKYKPTMEQVSYIVPISTIILLAFAYLAMVFYDEPLRKYLKSKK
ncbi:acyltransferase family protein [Pedobacter sp. MW01-1-1]|uniref:acyltransferase family protein n=1 Tax=Pedobacter sp. MW01-1-1 TaxID=3383027 RepID=UPI003FEF48A3